MSLQTTLAPVTPDKQFHHTYLVSTTSPASVASSRARSRSPGNARLSTLDPRQNAPISDGDGSVNGDGEWSSAVGRASVAGKSGRVIERLMNETDRLKRELNLAQARVEEEQQRSVSARETLESLRGTKENLEAICETNRNIIARRDRKIEELKAELELERSKRVDTEKARNDLSVAMHSLKLNTDKEVTHATEVAARAQAEYDTFRKSLQQMKGDYGKQLAEMRKELNVVQSDRDTEREKMRRLKRVVDELEERDLANEKTTARVLKDYADYKTFRDDSIREMAEQISNGDAANQQLHEDLQKTLGEMRWVMNVRKNVTSIQQRDEAGPQGSGGK